MILRSLLINGILGCKMTIYVDNPRKYKKRGKQWCHLFTDDPDTIKLHEFAKKVLHLKRQWFDGKRWPHYDITPEQQMIALKRGAIHAGRLRMIQIAKPAAYERISGRKLTLPVKLDLTTKPEKSSLAKSTVKAGIS